MYNFLIITLLFITSVYSNATSSLTKSPVSPATTQLSTSKEHDLRLEALYELFTTLGIKIDKTYSAMNAYAQAHWLRKPNQERWHMETSQHQDKLDMLIPSLKRLGMIDRVDPTNYTPDYAVVLGATVHRMRTRMQHMLELIKDGHFKPKKIVFLTGERPLDPTQEPQSILFDKTFIRAGWQLSGPLPTNESEAAKFIWNQLPKPDCIKDIEIIFVSTPMIQKGNKKVRPTTPDTINTWFTPMPGSGIQAPYPGSIVAFSNNPYVPYQNETMKPPLIKARWFKKGGTLETVGTAAKNPLDVANLLDNTARYIYSILQVEKLSLESDKK